MVKFSVHVSCNQKLFTGILRVSLLITRKVVVSRSKMIVSQINKLPTLLITLQLAQLHPEMKS